MSILTLEIAKEHLRVVGNEEDDTLQLYLDAAEEAASNYMNRQMFVDQAALDAAVAAGTAGQRPVVMTAAMRSAVLLMLGHLYANREDVVATQGVTAVELPLGSRALLAAYRIRMGV